MPWTAADAEKYQKGLTKKQRRKWAAIANAIFESTNDEAKAIKVACAKVEPPFNPAFPASLEGKLKTMTIAEAPALPEPQPSDAGEIPEMEIFRTGTHNGEPFDDKDLHEIATNYEALKHEVRPKLKITHREKQESLAGLASYGDIIGVFVKKLEDGSSRLFARVANVPKQVMSWIQDRRFPERSIEIYPKLKLGTKADDKIYRNVLKAIALLGSEMPAVTGMAPIKLAEALARVAGIAPVKLAEAVETQNTVCFGQKCFPCVEEAQQYQATLLSASLIAGRLAKKI